MSLTAAAQESRWLLAFYFFSAVGMLATPLWFIFVHAPKNHPRISEGELKHIEEGGGLVNMDMGAKAGARFSVKWSLSLSATVTVK